MPGRVSNVRPGLIVGERDRTNRFGRWPARVNRGGEVLGPGTGDVHCQFIDVKDLGAFCVHLGETKQAGVFNANGFDAHLSIAEFLHACKGALRTDVSFTWVPEAFLESQKVRPWVDLPLWLPADVLAWVNVEKAIAAGLTFRPICDTIRDALETQEALVAERTKAAPGRPVDPFPSERQAAVLAAWHASRKAPAPEPADK